MIIREIDGKEYKFAMTRRGLREAERQGFDLNSVEGKPMSALYYLWYAALWAAQPLSLAKSDELLDKYLDSENAESVDDVFAWLSDDFMRVFGRAVE